jgi:uncharacterized membrane protein
MERLKNIYQKVFKYFDRLEDRVRAKLSRYPIFYAVCAGIAVVMFWRGVWHTSDILEEQGGILGFLFSAPVMIITSTFLLLFIGVFVSAFVGDLMVLSGIKKEEKKVDRTEGEIEKESGEIQNVEQVVDDLYEEIDEVGERQAVIEKKIDDQSKLLKKLLDK